MLKNRYLAENEHPLWNAFHYVNGIRRWNISEMTKDATESKCKDKYRNILKLDCIMSFSELESVSGHINLNRELYNMEKTLR